MNAEKQYIQLQQDLKPYLPMLQKAADTVLDQDISRYPIFVVHRQDLELGIPLVAHGAQEPKWSIHITTLEELATKRLVEMDKVDGFRQVFKDPQDYLCLFAWNESDASFVFMPREA
ncbi:MAG: hypothetical protein IPJ74_21310 [Saprospiraceae bacterium]|nr:hypothetical protein [Saprospiraceae bacterium]